MRQRKSDIKGVIIKDFIITPLVTSHAVQITRASGTPRSHMKDQQTQQAIEPLESKILISCCSSALMTGEGRAIFEASFEFSTCGVECQRLLEVYLTRSG